MKHLGIIFTVIGLAAGCSGGGGEDSYGGPGPSPAPTTSGGGSSATSTTFQAAIAAANEAPSVSGSESNVNGTATITLKYNRDGSGNVSSATADFQVTTSGLAGNSTLTMAHIHRGGSGANGGILVDTGLTPGGASSGSFQRTGVNVSSDVAQGMLNDPGGYYFNVHSAANPNGVARGQLGGSSGGSPGTDPPPEYGYESY